MIVTSDPWSNDTDGDGLSDGQEFENATDPRGNDTDGDGLDDGEEDADLDGAFEPGSNEKNPRWQDTDNDSVSDGLELGGF